MIYMLRIGLRIKCIHKACECQCLIKINTPRFHYKLYTRKYSDRFAIHTNNANHKKIANHRVT